MSIPNRRRGLVPPPPPQYDPEWENRLRLAMESKAPDIIGDSQYGWSGQTEGDVGWADYDTPFRIQTTNSSLTDSPNAMTVRYSWEQILTAHNERNIIRDNDGLDGGPRPVMLVYQGDIGSDPIDGVTSDSGAWRYLGLISSDASVTITEDSEYIDLTATVGVPSSRMLNTTSPLTGGGDLSADRTFSLAGLTTLGTALYMPRTNAGATAWEYRSPAQILSDIGAASAVHTHLLAAGATDVTASAAEVNILDLAGLTTGWVYQATGATSAAWQAITAASLPTGIDAAKLADGSVSNAELQYCNSLTSNAQTQLDAKQPLDATLTSIAALGTAADKLAYTTGVDTWAETALTAAARTVLDDASVGAMLTTLGGQPLDATLTALAGLVTGADKLAYSTGVDTFSQTDLTTYGRSLLDDANASACRDTLGAASGIWGLALGGTAADLSATGGTSQFLRQSSAGAAITVSAIAHADLGASGGTGTKYLRDDMSWQTVSAGVTGSGVANQVAYWSGTSALTGDADLVFNGTQLLTSGLFVGALTGTPARVLESRSTSAQVRGSYDATNYWEIAASSVGGLSITAAGSAPYKTNVGGSSSATGAVASAFGYLAVASVDYATALGAGATCSVGTYAIAIGYLATAAGANSITIGANATHAGSSGVTIGFGATCAGNSSITIGHNATCAAANSLSAGYAATCGGVNSLTIGANATHAGSSGITMGYGATCAGAASSAIGYAATCAADYSLSLGYQASCASSTSFAIGVLATAVNANEGVFGSSSYPISNIYAGKGVTNATPTAWTLNGTGGSGTDIAGGPLKIGGGKPSGAGAGGSVILQTAPAGASGTTLRTLVDRLTVDQLGNIYPGTAALATGATDGFIYLQSCAGAPSGTPTTVTGRVPTIVDTTNGRLYAYYGAAWHYLTFT